MNAMFSPFTACERGMHYSPHRIERSDGDVSNDAVVLREFGEVHVLDATVITYPLDPSFVEPALEG